MKRYTVTSDWRENQSITIEGDSWSDTPAVTVVHESADIHANRDGFDYRDGAHRVRSFLADGTSYKRARRWYGESAWMSAEREFSDIANAVRYAR